MNNLAQSEVFSLTLVIGTYLASLALYRKTRISLLHPLITSIFVIIVVLKTMDIEIRIVSERQPPDPFPVGAVGRGVRICIV